MFLHYTEHSSIPTDIDWNLNLCINIFVGPLHAEWLLEGSHKHWNPEIRRVTPSPGLTIVPPCKGCNVQNKEMVAGIQDTLDIKWTPSGPHRCEMVSLTDIACLTILFFLFTLGTTHLQKLLPSQVSQQVVVLVWWTVITRTTAHRVPTPKPRWGCCILA